jgi:glutamate-1-semialdehyde 2,1-aminomutase
MTVTRVVPEDVSPGSLRAWQRAKSSIGGGVSSGLRAGFQPYPIFVERASGPLMWDVDGKEYVDFVGAWGPMVLGHSHPGIVDAVAEVLPRMQMPGTGHALEYEAAEAVLEAVPGAERLLWSNTGTEAVQIALRLARAHTGRMKILKFNGAYHGWHDSVLVGLTQSPPNIESGGQNPKVLEDVVVLPFNDADAVTETLERAAELDIAAVLIDPILNSGGGVEPDPHFLETLRAQCSKHGVVLIFDEVITGFRVARGGASERWGGQPDLVVFGKALANGFSQSAVAGRADIIDRVNVDVWHAGTYNGNPIALAAVKAAMAAYAEPDAYARLERVATRFEEGLADVVRRTGVSADIHRVASIVWINTPDPKLGASLVGELAGRGVLLLPRGEMFVSMAHGDEHVDRAVAAFADAVEAISGRG